jgi:hypothetical protein
MDNLYLDNSIEVLDAYEMMSIDGGSRGWAVLEMAAGVVLVGAAVAVEAGTLTVASVPAAWLATAGVGLILDGAHKY